MASAKNSERFDDGKIGVVEFHWMLEMLQNIDAGLTVLDKDYRVQLWNGFMENHSGVTAARAKNQIIFSLFDQLPEKWFKSKAHSAFVLNSRSFTTWEQRDYVFPFQNYRPITGTVPYMFQNMTIVPMTSLQGVVEHICVIIYDVTDIAISRKGLDRANDALKTLSQTDRLTGLLNRGYWESLLEKEFRRFKRTKQPDTLVMLDIDHFKKVNDTFGHQAGDLVICNLAGQLMKNARETDVLGRYGGEEFGIILIDTPASNAQVFCERLRKNIEAKSVQHRGSKIDFTISLGCAESSPELSDHQSWLNRADEALYISKKSGRNQTTIWQPK